MDCGNLGSLFAAQKFFDSTSPHKDSNNSQSTDVPNDKLPLNGTANNSEETNPLLAEIDLNPETSLL